MHRLLRRQVKKTLGSEKEFENLDPKLKSLINLISEVYNDFDEQRRMSEHIITVNSEELRNSNDQLEELLEEHSLLLKNKTIENKDITNILQQYREAIDKTLIVSRTDKKGIITYVNDNFCKISEYTESQLIGQAHNIIRDPNMSKEVFIELWETIKRKDTWNGIISNRSKTGNIYYVKSTIIPILDRDGNITEYMALRDDITKQILYQEKLTYQTQRLNTIFNSQEHISIIIKPKEGIVEANKKFFDTFEYQSLEKFKKEVGCICNLFKEKDILKDENSDLEWYEKFLEHQNSIRTVTRINHYGFEQIFNISSKEMIIDKEKFFLVTLIDITELESARRNAEVAKEAKSIFLANMSHEVRTPLNAIIGFSDILRNGKLENESKEYANIISRSAESLLDIIDDVLDISKIESGNLQIEKEAFEISIFIENIVELFSVRANEKNIRFIFDSDPKLPYRVINDSTRIRQLLSNLLSNAIKFTDEKGQVTFQINVLKKDKKNVSVEFLVIDTGIGMSNEQIKIIFNPFSQADAGISRKYGGTGLGLTISKDIAKLLDSKIDVISEKNKGTTFKFILDFEIDKNIDEKDHHFTETTFAVSDIYNDDEHLKSNVVNYLIKIGRVFDFNEDSIFNNIDILFCFNYEKLDQIIENFSQLNKGGKIVFVGDEKEIKEIKNYQLISNFIDLPIYGSKIFNIIFDNSEVNEKNITTEKIKEKSENYNKEILVAEDNQNNQILIKILLEQLGIKCTIVENGIEVVEEYSKKRYDLVLMDINMPLMDGVSATKEILRKQKEENLYKVPIIALTANSLEGDKEKYIADGMDDYISKPIIFDKLKEIIEEHTILNQTTFELSDIVLNYKKEDAVDKLGVSQKIVDLLFQNFLENIDEDMRKLEIFIQKDDFNNTENQAHYIKGSCLNLAMNDAVELLNTIEENAKINIIKIEEFEKLKNVIKSLKKLI